MLCWGLLESVCVCGVGGDSVIGPFGGLFEGPLEGQWRSDKDAPFFGH